MSEENIVVRRKLPVPGSLYYYQGNFFYPINYFDDYRVIPEEVWKRAERIIEHEIKQFKKKNAARIALDRKHPDYKTLVELMDLEPYEI